MVSLATEGRQRPVREGGLLGILGPQFRGGLSFPRIQSCDMGTRKLLERFRPVLVPATKCSRLTGLSQVLQSAPDEVD